MSNDLLEAVLSEPATAQNPKAFVLMPFHESQAPIYEKLIKEPLEKIGFEVKRADSDWHQRSVLRDFVIGIVEADLVIADVTGLNSNVMYELGLAHALGARTVTITKDISEMPFDLQPYRATEYSTEFDRAHELSDALVAIGTALLEGRNEFGNPIRDYAPHALRSDAPVNVLSEANGETAKSSNPDTSSARRTKGDDTPGFLEASVELDRISEKLTVVSASLGTRTQAIGDSFVAHTTRIEELQRKLGQKAPAAGLAIANQVAVELDDYRENLERESDDFAALMQEFNSSVEAIARSVTVSNAEELEAAQESVASTRQLELSFLENKASVQEFAATMENMPNASRRLKQSARRTAGAVGKLADRLEEAAAETARIRGITESRIDAYLRSERD